MVGICDLPLELLIGVLCRLDKTSVKQSRLTCRHWAESGAHCLSHRVYYAPRHDRVDIFASIPEGTAFAASFTELVYDARLFYRGVLGDPHYRFYYQDSFHISLNEDGDRIESVVGGGYHDSDSLCRYPDLEERLQKSREQYASCLRRQTSILETGQDMDTLCMAMKRLPNLRKISILDTFEDVVDTSPFISTQHQWYRLWTTTQFKGIVMPSKFNGIRQQPVWDYRGIENLFKAVSLYAPKMQNLVLGCEPGIFSTTIYGKPNIKALMENLVPRLRKLKVDCDTSFYGSISAQWSNDIASLLHEGRQLNEMSLYLGRSMTLKGQWPQLRILEFSSGHLDLPTLKAFSQFHADVLRELTLHDVELRGKYSWEQVAEEIGQHWKLDLLSLNCIIDGTNLEEHIRGLRRLEPIARSFMLRIPDDELNMVNTEVAVIAWHQQKNYLPSPEFKETVFGSSSEYAIL